MTVSAETTIRLLEMNKRLRESLIEIREAWRPVLKVLDKYEKALPYAELINDDDVITRMCRAVEAAEIALNGKTND